MLPGAVDDIVEILPTSIILDEIDISIGELREVTIGTIIGLEKELSAEVELRVANMPVALESEEFGAGIAGNIKFIRNQDRTLVF